MRQRSECSCFLRVLSVNSNGRHDDSRGKAAHTESVKENVYSVDLIGKNGALGRLDAGLQYGCQKNHWLVQKVVVMKQ